MCVAWTSAAWRVSSLQRSKRSLCSLRASLQSDIIFVSRVILSDHFRSPVAFRSFSFSITAEAWTHLKNIGNLVCVLLSRPPINCRGKTMQHTAQMRTNMRSGRSSIARRAHAENRTHAATGGPRNTTRTSAYSQAACCCLTYLLGLGDPSCMHRLALLLPSGECHRGRMHVSGSGRSTADMEHTKR